MELLVLTAIISRFKDIFIGWYSIKGSDIRSFKTKKNDLFDIKFSVSEITFIW
jgi:hypothetical protein